MPYTRTEIDRGALLRTGARLAAAALVPGLLLDTHPAAAFATNLAAPGAKPRPTVDAFMANNAAASMASLQAHATHITRLNPSWYALDDNLEITGKSIASVIRLARENGIALFPLIRNARFDPAIMERVLQSPARRTQVAARIATLVIRHGFDGINLDFEGPYGAYRDQYSDFARQIAARLRQAGKGLTVDVATQLAPVSRLPLSSWSAPFDYAALAETSDALIVMAYAHSIRRPGSLAPLWWVTDAMKVARAQAPANKLVVGAAFYGRQWVLAGKHITHTDLTQADAEMLLAASGAVLERPLPDATPRFTWDDVDGTHIVHYEDGKSLAAKLRVARAAGVAGAAFWRLGLEQPSQWGVIATTLHTGT